MKDISTILLASVFVLFSLIVLISAASTPDRTSSTLDNDQQESQILDCVSPSKSRVTEVLHTQRPLWWAMRRPDQRFLNRV